MPLPLIPIILIGGTAASLALQASQKPETAVIIARPQKQSFSFPEIKTEFIILAVIVFILLLVVKR